MTRFIIIIRLIHDLSACVVCLSLTGGMGIHGLTTFMKEKFLGWRDVDLKALDCVIIDGSSVCCTLYRLYHTWGLGGDHAEFYETVEKFFTDANFKKPIVVFDGISDEDKAPLLHEEA